MPPGHRKIDRAITKVQAEVKRQAGTVYSVLITNRSMRDFVTGNTAEMIFHTREEAEAYVKSSETFHPGRFSYSIQEISPSK